MKQSDTAFVVEKLRVVMFGLTVRQRMSVGTMGRCRFKRHGYYFAD